MNLLLNIVIFPHNRQFWMSVFLTTCETKWRQRSFPATPVIEARGQRFPPRRGALVAAGIVCACVLLSIIDFGTGLPLWDLALPFLLRLKVSLTQSVGWHKFPCR